MTNSHPPESGRLATPSQRLLLRGALLEGERALEAWREWDRREVIEELDSASDGLVGLLWRNLDAHGVEHETMPKLKGVYRHTWFKNQTVLRQAGIPIRVLRKAGIPTLALKGATLCPLYYRDWGVRRMEDFDLLVPPDRATDAMAALRAIGATPSGGGLEREQRRGLGSPSALGAVHASRRLAGGPALVLAVAQRFGSGGLGSRGGGRRGW